MIEARPFDDLTAMAVFRDLDPMDRIEAELIRGASCTHLGLFADWRAAQAGAVLSRVILTGPERGARPFAVLVLGHTGQAGVAQAALLARQHRAFRRELAALARVIRQRMPDFCAELGIQRIEARCWAGHPSASRLLAAVGFAHECDMSGFGGAGRVIFRQFAWTAATQPLE